MPILDLTDTLSSYEQHLLTKMNTMFERQMNRIINEYQEKLRMALVDLATDYTIELHDCVEDFDNQRRIIVEVKWPDDKTEDSEVGYRLGTVKDKVNSGLHGFGDIMKEVADIVRETRSR